MKTSRSWGTIGTVQIEAQIDLNMNLKMDRRRESPLGRNSAAVGLHMRSTFWQLKDSRKVVTASQNNSCSELSSNILIMLSDSMTS